MTERQQEIARAVALGESVQVLARRLGVRPQSVRRHLTHIYDGTTTWSQAQLTGWCVAHGLVTVGELQGIYGHGEQVDSGAERQSEGPAA